MGAKERLGGFGNKDHGGRVVGEGRAVVVAETGGDAKACAG